MDDISDVTVGPCVDSAFVKTFSVCFSQNGRKKKWDCVHAHDSVATLLYHKERQSFVFVKQFRPAVYIKRSVVENNSVDVSKYGGHLGLTHELCAGIVDKTCSLIQIAQEEVLEECGYNVPIEKIRKITSFTCVGTEGCRQTLFYAELTDAMKETAGGGLENEGELIETVEIPVTQGREFMMNEDLAKPAGMMLALYWFYDEIYPKIFKT